jgi:hypothetical protein
MIHSNADHGIFTWHYNKEASYIALETDDIIIASTTCSPFLHLKAKLEKLFDLKSNEGSILRFP